MKKINPSKNLSDYSERDKPWDSHRVFTDRVGGIYARAQEFERYAERMGECSGLLHFGWSTIKDTGETRLRLRAASFCRVRHCPVCQWRRSLMWQARFFQALPALVAQYDKSRWLFLTLTVRNCAIEDLADTLKAMNSAFQRMKVRKEFSPVQGWIKTTEVTRGRDGSAHPHFHCLLMVPPSWFSGIAYIKQSRWVELWAECLRVDYLPNVDIRTVKTKSGDRVDDVATQLQFAVAETLKYSVKPEDMVSEPEWFLEMTRQLHKKRFIATGGALKDILKLEQESNDDLVIADDVADGDDDGKRIAFAWNMDKKHYRRCPEKDKSGN